MKTINEEVARWVQIGLFAFLWVGLLGLHGHRDLSWSAIKELPHVVFLYTIMLVIFVKWGWRWRIFRGWLVNLPDLQGTWEGSLQSTWKNPATGEVPGSIPARMMICQTFREISCTLRTGESESESTAALISKSEASENVRLSYVYSNRPAAGVRHRSEIHDGACVLGLRNDGNERRLEGQYWTSRQTTGDMAFAFKTREI